MIKVLHIIPRWIGGGPERHLIELARQDRLQHRNVTRRVLVLDRPLSAPLLVKARKFGMSLVSEPWTEIVNREIENADLVDVTYWNHPLMLQLILRPLPECRIVFSVAVAGDSLPQIIFPDLTHYPDAWVLSAPYGHGATHLNTQHSFVAHVPALADMTRLKPYKHRAHAGVRASYLGSLTPSKLHSKFPDIVVRVDHAVHFDLFGDGDDHSLEQLSAVLRRRDVEKRVTIHGHVEDVAEAFAETDIFVYPLNPESSATSEKSLQEAMWLGIPPIMLTGTAAAGWIRNGVNGFLAPDEASFAEIVNDLASNPARRRQIGLAAMEYARRNFDPGMNAMKLHEIYERVMSIPKRVRESLSSKITTGSEIFLHSIDLKRDDVMRRLKVSSEVSGESNYQLVRAEGGVLHYLKHYAGDIGLREMTETIM
jgi:glycosyltransferase involved in cell wall biosynthesis